MRHVRSGGSFGGLLLTALLAGIVPAIGQTNPDISVIPRFRISTTDGERLPAERSFSSPRLTLDEFEIAITGYLNPYARADVFLAKGGDEDEPLGVEEAYASFLRGLPLDLNVRIGKYLVDFGKLNMQHPHSWPFVDRPLSHQRFLGEEGLNDLGVSASILLPTGDIYSRLSVDVLTGDPTRTLHPSAGEVSGGIGLADSAGAAHTYAFAGRLMGFVPIGEESDLEVGFSALSGVHDPYRDERFLYLNLDAKFKWKPDLYTSLTLQGEFLMNVRRVAAGGPASPAPVTTALNSSGLYVYADYQFSKIYTIGSRLDWSESPYAANDRASGVTVWLGFYPVEESSAFRLQAQRTTLTRPAGDLTINSVALQFLFSLGPHKAHPF